MLAIDDRRGPSVTGAFVPMDFDCITPLGPARCRGMWVAGDVTEWLCDIDATREPWWFANQDFRFGACVTDRGGAPSPFGEPNEELARQIERYRKNGWLSQPTPKRSLNQMANANYQQQLSNPSGWMK